MPERPGGRSRAGAWERAKKITGEERERLWQEAHKNGMTIGDMGGKAISTWLKVQKTAAKFRKK